MIMAEVCLERSMVLIKGIPRTSDLVSISKEDNEFIVQFKKGEPYSYKRGVVILTDPIEVPVSMCRIYRNGVLQKEVAELLRFNYGFKAYWRIKYLDGKRKEGMDEIQVIISCLSEIKSQNVFEYFKRISTINQLGIDAENDEQTKEQRGILASIYEKVNFIDPVTAASCYINPDKHKVKQLSCRDLIYPFGCNVSQKKAVEAAFSKQISVIQGPPGTGKTQTILNIIANIVRHQQTVLVVSNNNSATANVLEKLEKYGFGFIVASLGSQKNKADFIQKQPKIPSELSEWNIDALHKQQIETELLGIQKKLDEVFELQNKLAVLRQEIQAVELEWRHFCMSNGLDADEMEFKAISSSYVLDVWTRCQWFVEMLGLKQCSLLSRLRIWFQWLGLKYIIRHRIGIHLRVALNDLWPVIIELQKMYYLNKDAEIRSEIKEIEKQLLGYDASALLKALEDCSKQLFKDSLALKYGDEERMIFRETGDLRRHGDEFLKQYPVVLSTTFSAWSNLFSRKPYDYIIIDEASQVSIETGALALTCAKNAVIVGDALQLPNVVTSEDRKKMRDIMDEFAIPEGYDCTKHSFLTSVCAVLEDVQQTVLREHYRCHPRIINFCNQKFYGGELLIMTQDKGEQDVMSVIKTVKGNHAVERCNLREIEVVQNEVLPALSGLDSVGIIAPYHNQVEAFHQKIPNVEADTIHKYQGREKDAIVMSVVDNYLSSFSDDPHLLNVAVSRAKVKFCLVVTGNEQRYHGNVMDLVDYIRYNNCSVTESKIASIFDYLYEQYTKQRMELLAKYPKISVYESENLTYGLIRDVLQANVQFRCLNVLCHVPLAQIIKDTTLLNEEECKFVKSTWAHVDFLIINSVGKKPVLAVETDGYTYHNSSTKQFLRDEKKNRIFKQYDIPLLRLSTKGSGEKEKLEKALSAIVV